MSLGYSEPPQFFFFFFCPRTYVAFSVQCLNVFTSVPLTIVCQTNWPKSPSSVARLLLWNPRKVTSGPLAAVFTSFPLGCVNVAICFNHHTGKPLLYCVFLLAFKSQIKEMFCSPASAVDAESHKTAIKFFFFLNDAEIIPVFCYAAPKRKTHFMLLLRGIWIIATPFI